MSIYMAYICEECGQSFDTELGLNVHCGKTVHRDYHRRDYLYEQYVVYRKSAVDIADEFGIDTTYVLNLLDRHGIDRRSLSEAFKQKGRRDSVPLYMGGRGYEFWQDRTDGTADKVYLHRLLAVAEFGVGAVADMDVHHKNGVKWDNRPENIELLTKSEHARQHGTD